MNNNENRRPTDKVAQRKKNEALRLQREMELKKRNRDLFFARMVVFISVFVLVSIIAVICIGCQHSTQSPPPSTDADITLDKGESTVDKNASLSTFLENDVIYINFSELALKCEMTITGTDEQQTFSVKNGDVTEYLSVTSGSVSAIINGVSVQMPHKAILKGADMWLCLEFVSNAVNGVTVKYDSENNKLTIKRTELNASTATNPLYEKVSFGYNITKPVDTVTDNGISSEGPATTTPPDAPPQVPTYEFKADLSDYEQYMNPADRDAYIILVNKDNMIGEDYIPADLTTIYGAASTTDDRYKMTFVAAMALEAMIKEAKANGLNVYGRSGYRSYARQHYLVYDYYPNLYMSEDKSLTYEQALAKTLTDTALPGASEHQTGLSMDVNSISQSFGATKEGKWLAENCYKFGFILRYPKDKEDITKITWEPWHFRFVGRYHAEKMHELGMCLEEYTEYLNNN